MKKVNGVYKEDPVHIQFNLTYANWFTWPRVLMESMPYEWQQKFVELWKEFDETFPEWFGDLHFYVNAKKENKYTKLPEHLCNYRHPDRKSINDLKVQKFPR